MTTNAHFTKDIPNRKITVVKEFSAPVEKLWRTWTEAELLDKWWAPRPWKTVTKTLDFTDGGQWLYAMTSPTGEAHYSIATYSAIAPQQSFKMDMTFCDENGVVKNNFSVSHWFVEFDKSEAGTKITATISYDSDEDIQRMVTMGFEGGFTMGLNNLEELLASE